MNGRNTQTRIERVNYDCRPGDVIAVPAGQIYHARRYDDVWAWDTGAVEPMELTIETTYPGVVSGETHSGEGYAFRYDALWDIGAIYVTQGYPAPPIEGVR